MRFHGRSKRRQGKTYESVNGRNFGSGQPPPPSVRKDRALERAEAERAIADFLAKGGAIRRPADPTPLPPGADPDPPWDD